MTAHPRLGAWTPGRPSLLMYQTRLARPMLARAEGVYLWDTNGDRRLDGSSGAMVSNIGHSHPKVLEAMRDQMARSTFGYRLHFENEPAERLAAAIAHNTPAGVERVFFTSGGSEAVESCLKLARQYAVTMGQASRWKVISRSPSYHGATLGALAVTSYRPLNAPFAPMTLEHPKIPAPRVYLDRDALSDHERGLRYAEMLREAIEREGPESVLAFIVEPVGGASTGALVAPDSYLPHIRAICDEYGVLLIADEVMSGLARTGAFLAVDHWGVAPDLVALAKGLGAGYVPLGAMAARRDIAETVIDSGGFAHGFTYAGNPLACAAGLAVLEVIFEEDLENRARVQGAKLKLGLHALMDEFEFIGDVRGRGLMLAFEIVADRETMEPFPAGLNLHDRLVDLAYDNGLIIYSRRSRDGVAGDHFLVCPPLTIDDGHIDEILTVLTKSLRQLAAETPAFAKSLA